MIVNALKVFSFNAEPSERLFRVRLFAGSKIAQADVDFAHKVFYKARVFIRMLGNKFLVLALQDRLQGTRRARFHKLYYVLNPKERSVLHFHGNNAALVVRAVFAYGF